MSEILVAAINLPFQALNGLISALIFPPRPLTPEEKLLRKIQGQAGQLRMQQDANFSLQHALRERDFVIGNLKDQLTKKEAELTRSRQMQPRT